MKYARVTVQLTAEGPIQDLAGSLAEFMAKHTEFDETGPQVVNIETFDREEPAAKKEVIEAPQESPLVFRKIGPSPGGWYSILAYVRITNGLLANLGKIQGRYYANELLRYLNAESSMVPDDVLKRKGTMPILTAARNVLDDWTKRTSA
jgi:hypothetical protein